jgi:hypothetical protein
MNLTNKINGEGETRLNAVPANRNCEQEFWELRDGMVHLEGHNTSLRRHGKARKDEYFGHTVA